MICALARSLSRALAWPTCTAALWPAWGAVQQRGKAIISAKPAIQLPADLALQEGCVSAELVHIRQETPTVKRFTLKPSVGPRGQRLLSFLPGQWVDFFIPGLPVVGGFSFVSTPRQLEQQGTFELAVKRSTHPPAAWMHEQAKVGDRVAVRVGGSFTYLPGDERRPLLLVAGGIGINPLYSILKHCCDLVGAAAASCARGDDATVDATGRSCRSNNHGSGSCEKEGQHPTAAALLARQGEHSRALEPLQPGCGLPHAAVLYSASVPEELAFRWELEQLQAGPGATISLRLHATAPQWKGRDAEWGGRWGRIRRPELQAALRWLVGAYAARDVCAQLERNAVQPLRSICKRNAGTSCIHGGGSGGGSAGGSGGGSRGSTSTAALQPLSQVAALVCGPAGMEDSVVADLISLGLHADQIRFEKWW